MRAEADVARDRPAFHTLSAEGIRSLVDGDEQGETVGELWRAERSRRLLFLRALYDRVSGGTEAAEAAVTEAWSLLERAQRTAPEAVEDILMAPGTGVWVSSALRRLRDGSAEEPPLWVTTGHLSTLAVAAATRARLAFSLEVPVCWGTVSLPGLGCATFPCTEPWTVARATGHDGTLRIATADTEVRVGHDWQRPATGWLPTRRLVLGPEESSLRLVLEEHDPYRAFSGPQAPRVLSPAEDGAWRSALAETWTILLRDEPTVADAMQRGALVSIAPAEPRERFRPYSSSAGEAFGGVSASLPDSPDQLAATLVHEFQHIKLGAVIHLDPLLYRAEAPDEREELFYAPWRDDPRPLEGLLQGIYAFFGVTRFWRSHRRVTEARRSPLADFEFAFCREQVWSTLNAVRHHARLTPVGHHLLDSMRELCARWLTEEVPDEELRLAREARADHRARWRAHHLRPSARAVEEAVRAWRRGDKRPPALLAAPPRPAPDTGAGCLDTAAVLARHGIVDPQGEWTRSAGNPVRGAGQADVLLARGERAAARRLLVGQLLTGDHPAGTWAILGRALADHPEHGAASRLLLRFPERARATQEALAAYGDRADPVRLAAWLAEGAGTA